MGKKIKTKKPDSSKKYSIIILFVLLILFLIIVWFYLFNNFKPGKVPVCGDGSFYYQCSSIRPYFCLNGSLVEKVLICGCPEIIEKEGEHCISEYQTNPKNISLKYVLRGEEKQIDYTVYGGMIDYLSNLSKSIVYSSGEEPSRRDFKIRNIDEEEQRELLLPLVVEIQNIAEDKQDQMRIAVSIVQELPFGDSGKFIPFSPSQKVIYSRYPYEVLYDMEGICEEKSELLAFLLREIGYGVAIFYYEIENHEAVGIKCPIKYSLDNTGYCFIETTGSSIITNNQLEYFGGVKLSSKPELILISEGDSLKDNLYEYKDAKDFEKINNLIEEKGKITKIQHSKLQELRKKYDLEE